MKRALALVAILILAAVAQAAPPTGHTNYYPGLVITTNTFADAGDTGLSTGTVYLCVPVGSITNAEFTAASITNDVRPFLSAMVKTMDTAIAAKASTNRFTLYLLDSTTIYGSAGTNRIVSRTITEHQYISVTPSYPSE